MQNVIVLENSLTKNPLTYLRDREITLGVFRKNSDEICRILVEETVNNTDQIKDMDIVIVPVLRAGIAMLLPALHLVPSSRVGFVGLERDETTAIAREYYWKLPPTTKDTIIVITDPMLATGGSVLSVLTKLKNLPHKEIRIVSVISAPEGIEAVHSVFPTVKIFTAAVDEGLDAKKYIVPGLGDYGDRYFGTL